VKAFIILLIIFFKKLYNNWVYYADEIFYVIALASVWWFSKIFEEFYSVNGSRTTAIICFKVFFIVLIFAVIVDSLRIYYDESSIFIGFLLGYCFSNIKDFIKKLFFKK